MSVLVFGRSGQVARELANLVEEENLPYVFVSRNEVDLSLPEACEALILAQKPSAVINAAAWTAVDDAETAEAQALLVNGEAPGAMSRACASLNIPFVHISSDYVFDGSGQKPWRPGDPVRPLSAYGRSKLLGERLVQQSGARAIILRTSWVFSPYGSNFVKTMLRLGAERNSINVVKDQIGGPTSARSIAEAVARLIEGLFLGGPSGIFHFTGHPDLSWAEFAGAIMDCADLPCEVRGISSADYPTLAPRPSNSRLDCESLCTVYEISRPAWHSDLREVLTRLRKDNDAS